MLDEGWSILDESAQEAAEALSQPEKPKRKKAKKPEPPVALKTCTIHLEDVIVELVEGQPVHGLTRRERDHLKCHKFIK